MIRTTRFFMDANFLLESEAAQLLYEKHAAPMPILDYHNHLSPRDIETDRRFSNLTEIWLEGDHYKWRAMRTNGVPEHFITGPASPQEKFMKWAATVPYVMRNPLYHWTHLELKNYFGIDQLLDGSTAEEIYETSSALLRQEDYSTLSLLRKMNVEVVCTTDDPADSLEHHERFGRSGHVLKMYPTFRPDKAYAAEDVTAFNNYLDRLGAASGTDIRHFSELLQALKKRIDFFDSLGCRASDHGLEHLYFVDGAEAAAPAVFDRLRSGKEVSTADLHAYKCAVLLSLCRFYNEKKWVQQFHLGALRNNNRRLLTRLGPDTGFDSIGDFSQARAMSRFFDQLDATDELAKTIIYNNNPADNEVFATMVGNYNDGSVPGKMQFGSGWWFLDQKDGMERQMNALSNMGLLSRFVGMITDSRSLLSFPRHEYFRRILCNLWGQDVKRGELPDDLAWIGKMVEGICYYNAKNYFRF